MRRVLVLVHCQEANRDRIEEAFIEKLVDGVKNGNFDKVIHLSASNIWGVQNSPIFDEICGFVNQIVQWDHHELSPLSEKEYLSPYEIDTIFDGISSYKEADQHQMEQSQWNIPLEDRRRAQADYPNNLIMWEDEKYPRQFAWIPEVFRDPSKWQGIRITLGGLFEDQCIQDVRQILEWMGIDHEVDRRLVGFAIED